MSRKRVYEVYVHYAGYNAYLVEATNRATAERHARDRYNNGDNGDTFVQTEEDITRINVELSHARPKKETA